MDDGAFQWDDEKATANSLIHGVLFELARDVFRDPFAIDWRDEREDCGEDRFAIVGDVQGRVHYVAYTLRGDAIRIISA